jgi:hypothetical protein
MTWARVTSMFPTPWVTAAVATSERERRLMPE